MDELKAAGMQFNDITPAERQRMRAAAQPVVDRVLQSYDPALVQLLRSELARGAGLQ